MFNPIGALFFAIALKLVEPGFKSSGRRPRDEQS